MFIMHYTSFSIDVALLVNGSTGLFVGAGVAGI